ncbi:MAG TPA: hydroxyacid dehydrogenase [Vicinamibacterales bacterium]|jgi:D-3-phosphoglycerate dehydrogenase
MSPSVAFRRLAGHDVRTYLTRPSGPDDLADRIGDSKIVINIRSTSRFTADVLERCPALRLISIWGTGTDNVDLAAARTKGVRVTNTPGVSAVAVAEHTIALIMAVAKQIVQVDQEVRHGRWPQGMVTELRGKTLGLIGTGAIGREVARLGAAIGMRVIAWTFHPRGGVAEWVTFDEVFRQSDVVSIHLRLSTDTAGLIRREHFELMKPGAILINTARGAIVNESDLVQALLTNRIAGAGLDVFETEPLPAASPLSAMRNVVLTPHAAGITPEATEAGLALAIENAFAFLAGQPTNVVA